LCLQGAVDKVASADPAEGEDLARKERKRILELVQSRGMQRGSYPQFDVAVKGQKVVPPPNFSGNISKRYPNFAPVFLKTEYTVCIIWYKE